MFDLHCDLCATEGFKTHPQGAAGLILAAGTQAVAAAHPPAADVRLVWMHRSWELLMQFDKLLAVGIRHAR